jgi:hypothetical protein
LIVLVVVGIVIGVDFVVIKAASMTAAVIGAGGSAASTTLETIEAFALPGCVITSASARAFCICVEIWTERVQRRESLGEGGLFYWIGLSRVIFVVANETTWGAKDNILSNAIVQQFILWCYCERWTDRAFAE